MQKQTLALLAGALLLTTAGALFVPQWLADDDVPLVRWDAKDEIDVQAPADGEAESAYAENGVERTAVEADPNAGPSDETRVAVTLRGRVVNKFQLPVADAKVYLDFGRGGQRPGGPGGRQRRVPDPVQSDREGRFAFQGQTFRNLRVSLQVAHQSYAAGLFDKDLGEVAAENDLGDLVLSNGGELIGRVTDLEGNGIASAKVELGPENGNRFRQVRNRENLVAPIETDNNGYYRRPHVLAGDWTASATAKLHTEGRSAVFAVEEDQQVEVDDIRLGPGFEVTGYVRTTQGQPIAKADVTMRGQNPNRGGRNGRGGGPGGGPGGAGEDLRAMFGRDHSTTTDEQGRFFLEHLPGVPLRLEAHADGYLDFNQDGIDAKLGQPILVALQDGLRIAGTVVDAVDGQVVKLFAVRATRVRGLPVAGQANVDIQSLMTQLRSGNLDEGTQQQLRVQVESLRATVGADFRRGGPGGGGPGGRGNEDGGGRGPGQGRDLGKPEKHPDGTFVVTGLQEGVYEVVVQSPDHARYRSQEVELRLGLAVPTVAASLDRGVYVAGVVTSEKGQVIAGARVELRGASAFDALGGRGRRGGRGGNGEAGAAPGSAAPGSAAPGSAAPGGAAPGGMDLETMGREFLRQANGAQATLEATTDAEGVFVIKHAARGSYRLQAQAKGFANANTENFDLQADRSGFALQLGLLGSVTGHVRGLQSKELTEAHVAAVQVNGAGGGFGAMMGRGRGGPGGGGGGPFNSVNVQPDGTYRIDDLVPGDYIVRAWIGSAQDMMREIGPQFAAGTVPPDVKVKGGEAAVFDVLVTRPQIGVVAGSVLHNGSAASGFRVELARVDENGAAQQDGGRGPGGRGQGGGRGGGGMFGGGRSFQATVASSGQFSIKDVPAGEYRLRVQPARRGGILHEETLLVVAEATTERAIQISTASLRGTVTRDDNGNASELNGSVALHPGLTTLPENYQAWRREPGNASIDARVQNGAFQFETVKPDNYLLVVSIRGRERTTMPVVVTPGSDQPIVVAAGKVSAVPAGTGENATPRPRSNGNAGTGQPPRANGRTGR